MFLRLFLGIVWVDFFLWHYVYFARGHNFSFVLFVILRARVNVVLDRGKNSSGVCRFFSLSPFLPLCGAFRVV